MVVITLKIKGKGFLLVHATMAVNICLRFLVASIKLVFFILLLCDGFHAADFQNTMFNICDKNADNKLSKSELRECLGASAAERISTRVDPTTIMNLMDLDKDGEISLPEYMKIVSNVQGGKSDPIEVVDRDGNKKTYTSEELFQKMSDSPEDLKMDGDKLVKENEGTTNLNELAKDHPMVSNVVTLGQWSLAKLIEQGIVKNGTTILNLRTLSVEEIAAESAGNRKGLLSPQQIYKVWFYNLCLVSLSSMYCDCGYFSVDDCRPTWNWRWVLAKRSPSGSPDATTRWRWSGTKKCICDRTST